jgi:hypothetical protein
LPHRFAQGHCPRCEGPRQTDVGSVARALDGRAAAVAGQRDELRAILAPLLDHPLVYVERLRGWRCQFCAAVEGTPHAGECPVLRRDVLLGRA